MSITKKHDNYQNRKIELYFFINNLCQHVDKDSSCRFKNDVLKININMFAGEFVMISWDFIIKICGDEEIAKEVVKMFLNDSPHCVKSMTEAVQAQDAKLIKLYAHSLKGAASHIGAVELSQRAYQLECAGRDKNIEQAIVLFEQIQEEYEKIISFLSQSNWIELAMQNQTASVRSE